MDSCPRASSWLTFLRKIEGLLLPSTPKRPFIFMLPVRGIYESNPRNSMTSFNAFPCWKKCSTRISLLGAANNFSTEPEQNLLIKKYVYYFTSSTEQSLVITVKHHIILIDRNICIQKIISTVIAIPYISILSECKIFLTINRFGT